MLTATNQPQEISCGDLFCGVGGLTHGFVREGLQVNLGIDIDPACRYPYEKNNDVTFVQTDVGRISSSENKKDVYALGLQGARWLCPMPAVLNIFATL